MQLLSLMSLLFVFAFVACTLESYLKNHCQDQCQGTFPLFSSRSFMFWGLTIKPLIYHKLICVSRYLNLKKKIHLGGFLTISLSYWPSKLYKQVPSLLQESLLLYESFLEWWLYPTPVFTKAGIGNCSLLHPDSPQSLTKQLGFLGKDSLFRSFLHETNLSRELTTHPTLGKMLRTRCGADRQE